MVITVVRDNIKGNAQFGKMYIDDIYQCETLENLSTLIPCDTFKLGFRTEGGWFTKEKDKDKYNPFHGMIEIKDVPDRTFILIHPANTTDEIEGCIAVGERRDEANFKIYPSRTSYYPVYQKIANKIAKGGSVSIKITLKGGNDMGIIDNFNKIISGGTTDIIKGVGNVIDNLHTSEKEKLEAELKIRELISNHTLKMQANVTNRWTSDNNSGSWLARNIRPYTLLFLVVIFVVISIFDGNIVGFKVSEAYLPIYHTLLITVIGAYFGGRSFEKIKIHNSGDKK